MPLSNLKIRNWRQANVSPAADNNNLVVNGDTVYNTHALAKSARLTISNINTDQYNSEFENDGSLNVGYWTVCARDLSISGHSGKEKSHWVNQFNNSSPNCPLYHTEWDPGNTPMLGIYAQQAIEENGGFLPTWLQPPTPCSNDDLEAGICDRNDWYIRFKPSDIKNQGDQNQAAGAVYGTGSNPSVEYDGALAASQFNVDAAEGDNPNMTSDWWISNLANNPQANWVEDGQDAMSLLDDNIELIMMRDSIGCVWDPTAAGGYRGLQGNEVYVWIIFKEDLQITTDTVINVDIDGDANFYNTHSASSFPENGGFPPGSNISLKTGSIPIVTNGLIELIHSGGEDVKITPMSLWTSREKERSHSDVVNGIGEGVSRITLSGSALSNRAKRVAKIELTAPDGSYFSTPPQLKTKLNHNIRWELKDKTSTRVDTNGREIIKKITSYKYDLFYKGTLSSSILDVIRAELLYETSELPTRVLGINNIVFGSNIINPNGESRKIVISGVPGSSFGLAINENYEENITLGSETLLHFDKGEDKSILSGQVVNKRIEHQYGKKLPIVYGVIGKSGHYSFNQNFPSLIAATANCTNGVSASTTVDLDDTTGIRVNDRVLAKGISSTTIITVDTVNSTTRITVSDDITIAAKQTVRFKRDRFYSISTIPELTSTLSSTIPDTDPHYKLSQYRDDSVITIKHSPAADFAVTHHNGSATSLSDGVDFDLTYPQKSAIQEFTKVELTLDMASSPTFTAVKIPIYDHSDQTASDWTNSVSSENGGSIVDFSRFKWGATGSGTIKMTYWFKVVKWGTKNVTLELNLDDVITHS